MKKGFLLFLAIVLVVAVQAQDPKSAQKGVTYRAGTTADGSIAVEELEKNLKDNKYEGKITGKVTEVCQEKGCWMKVERASGETL